MTNIIKTLLMTLLIWVIGSVGFIAMYLWFILSTPNHLLKYFETPKVVDKV